jgi:hypothetical protein
MVWRSGNYDSYVAPDDASNPSAGSLSTRKKSEAYDGRSPTSHLEKFKLDERVSPISHREKVEV